MSCWRLLAAVAVAVLGGAAGTACEPNSLELVGSPGGVYRPGEGCTLVPGAPICADPSLPKPELQFESETDTGISADMSDAAPNVLTNLRVTCARSYCGSGSLEADSTLTWVDDNSNDPRRMASFAHTFSTPLDLKERTIGFHVYVDTVTLPMHAQIGVISDYWHWVGWTPLTSGWNQIQGVVSAANPLTKIDASVTSIPVSEIRMDVYVPGGTNIAIPGSWTGKIFLDDVSW